MTADALLLRLERWRDAGWLRSLDLALARFILDLEPGTPPSLLLATALVASFEGRGHTAMPLDASAGELAQWLAWPPEAAAELAVALSAWPHDADEHRRAWHDAAAVEREPTLDSGRSPLVESCGLLYLRRCWRDETRIAAQVQARAAAPPNGIDLSAARVLLDALFEPRPLVEGPDWQKIACALALRARITLLTGGPGTGKTYTATRLLALLQSLHADPQPLRVALAAPTGKAAARLRQSISQGLQAFGEPLARTLEVDRWAGSLAPARTLHALLGTIPGSRRFRHDASNPLDVDLIFVDEASMVHLELMARLLDALPAHARLVLLGDRDQLASVEAGSVMGELCDGAGNGEDGRPDRAELRYSHETADWLREVAGQALPPECIGTGSSLAQRTVLLRRSHRFEDTIGQVALAVNAGDGASALARLRAVDDGPATLCLAPDALAVQALALRGRAGAAGGYRPYLQRIADRPRDAADFDAWVGSVLRSFDAFRVLCALRDGPWGVTGLNAAIEGALQADGLLSRRGAWYEGRPVMVTRNDPALGVFNGDIGIVLRNPAQDGLRCYFRDGDGLRSMAVSRLADVETAFALTVHKSQGSEFDHVVLVLPDDDVAVLTRELIYTGITRARRAFTLLAKQPAVLVTASARRTRRVSGLGLRLR